MRQSLDGRTWREISNSFADKLSGSLPLLSPDAYNALLPVWLRAAVEQLDSEVAAMVSINLGNEPSKFAFTPSQASALIAVVEFVAANNLRGADDEDLRSILPRSVRNGVVVSPDPSIERTALNRLRLPKSAAHVEY